MKNFFFIAFFILLSGFVFSQNNLEDIEWTDQNYIEISVGEYNFSNLYPDVVDIPTLEDLGNNYSVDKNHVYRIQPSTDGSRYFGIIKWADPATFIHFFDRYYKDKNQVYYEWTVIPWADSDTFEIVHEKWFGYSKDKNHVYCDWQVLVWADPWSFEKHNDSAYYLDDNNGYTSCQLLEWADVDTLEVFVNIFNESTLCFKDQNSVYCLDSDRNYAKIHWINLNSVERIGRGRYIRDKDHVYYKASVVLWADPDSFRKFSSDNDSYNWYYIDSSSVYYDGKNTWIQDINSLESLWGDYYLADNKIIYWSEFLDISNTDSFQPIKIKDDWTSSDISWCFDRDDFIIELNQINIDDWGNLYYRGKKIHIFWSYKEGVLQNRARWSGLISQTTDNKFISLDRCSNWSLYFLPEREEKIDAIIVEKIVPMLEKDELETALENLIQKTEGYRYWTKSEAIAGTFYRHLMRNLGYYYNYYR